LISIFSSISNQWNDNGVDDSTDSVIVTSCGYQRFISKNLSISRPTGRLDYQIIYITKGKGYYSFEGKRLEVLEGNIIIYSPQNPQLYSYSAADSTELYWIHITGNSISDYLSKLGFLSRNIHYVGIHNEFGELFQKIIYELQIKNPMFKYLTAGYIIELISCFARKKACLESSTTILISEDIQKIIELMYKSYNKNYSVEDYAKFCNLSLYRFIHKFKQFTGMSPLDYITNIRINTARDLLVNSAFNISEVALLIGYDNPLYFSRVFKKLTGLCPSRFKDSTKKNSSG